MTHPAFIVQECPYPLDPLRLHAGAPDRYPCLLQSAASGAANARYDILFAGPGEHVTAGADGFLPALDAAWTAGSRAAGSTRTPLTDRAGNGPGDLPPFRGGWFVYLDYELAGEIEPRLRLPGRCALRAQAVRMHGALIRDHHRRRAWLCAEQAMPALLRDMARDVEQLAPVAGHEAAALPALALHEADPASYLEAVRLALAHIAAGDVFQANLAREWRGRFAEDPDPAALYRRLCTHNPAPFAGLARLDAGTVISSSPERLLAVRDGEVQTRPIAGTRPRSADEARDRDHQQALRASAKERAEHVMLIDLERNDLGRICTGGSVVVDEFMVLESYAHVHHIVSNVRGRLREDATPAAIIAALFPGGTITGCPKVRCMELIAALEGIPRGGYTGSMGYLNHDGSMDLNILIRTLMLDGRELSLRAGAGIVADSNPERELEETRAKARGLLLALDQAHVAH